MRRAERAGLPGPQPGPGDPVGWALQYDAAFGTLAGPFGLLCASGQGWADFNALVMGSPAVDAAVGVACGLIGWAASLPLGKRRCPPAGVNPGGRATK
jgi:hypothetical protein